MKDLIVIEENKEKENQNDNLNKKYQKTEIINKNANDNLVAVILILSIIVVIIRLVFYVQSLPSNNEKYLNSSDDIIITEYVPRNVVIKEHEHSTVETDERLKELVQTFNDSNVTYRMYDLGYELDAVAQGNIIIIETFGDGLSFSVRFELQDNILSSRLDYVEESKEISAIKMILACSLLDTVYQTKGFEEGDLLTFLMHEDSFNCDLETDGLCIEISDDNNFLTLKIDLNSDLTVVEDFWNRMDGLENYSEE